jgi:hypothetical protein
LSHGGLTGTKLEKVDTAKESLLAGPGIFVPKEMLEKLVQEELENGTEEAHGGADRRRPATDRS